LINRADAHYESGKWEEALEDYKKIREKFPDHANAAREEICQKKIDQDLEKKKDQVLGQLKDLGNNILGRFGMSIDNFKFQQNEQGGYSVQFQQGNQKGN